jgi:hypothetical protein
MVSRMQVSTEERPARSPELPRLKAPGRSYTLQLNR